MRRARVPALCAAALAAAWPQAHAQAEKVASYVIDPTHTFVAFEAPHFGTSTSRGRFEKLQGSLRFDRAAKAGRVEIQVATASISTGVAALDSRLREADVLDAAAFPMATFVSDRFVFSGDKLAEVEGQLTLVGKTLPLTLKATNFNCYLNPLLLRETCGGDFEALLQRSRWGMVYGDKLGLPDTIRLLVQIEATRE